MSNYPYSSTQLRVLSENCPKALDYLKTHGSDDPMFDAGVTAHAVIERVISEKAETQEKIEAVSDAVAFQMISAGYKYNGQQQPPRSADKTFEGVQIAQNYLYSIDLPNLFEGAQAEVKLGMTADMKACSYDDADCVFRGTIDLITQDEVGDEDFYAKGVTVCDWKTSMQAGENELDTLQRRGQAVLAWVHNPDAQFIKQKVVNLRTHAEYDNIIMLDESGIDTLKEWAKQILLTCRAAEQPRVARPGVGCWGCRYISMCEYTEIKVDNIATALVVAKAKYDALVPQAKKAIKDKVQTDKGTVGWQTRNGSEPVENAHHLLIKEWNSEDVSSLLAACELGVSNIKSVAKTLFTNKEERQIFLDQVLTEKLTPYFGIKKD